MVVVVVVRLNRTAVYIGHIKKSHDPLYTTAKTKKSCRSKMPYIISSRSVTDGVSCQSVSQNGSRAV